MESLGLKRSVEWQEQNSPESIAKVTSEISEAFAKIFDNNRERWYNTTMTNYNLIKLSEPGFDLRTEHLSVVKNVLHLYVCKLCTRTDKYGDFPENFNELPVNEQVDILLATSCGAEFDLETE
jgi:hypothetical protein